MFFIIFNLLFRVTPSKKYISFLNSKPEIKSSSRGCGNYDTLNESGDKDVNSVIECTTKDYEFNIKNSKFQNIHAKYFWKKAKDLPDKLIVIKSAKASIINNIIDDCSTDEQQLILCEDDNSDRTLKFNSNKITNCYKKDSGTYEILSTSYQNNEIMYNQITCKTDKSTRAFYIKYGRGCSFIGNTISNAYHGDSSAILINEQQSNNHKKLEIRDSIFINCKGDNSDGKNGGLILVIEKIDYDVLFSNLTFQDVKITKATKADNSYLIRLESLSSEIYPVNFSKCHFSGIETISKAGGGIGFFYNTDGAKTIIFDQVTFNNVVCNHGSIGGGALCVDSSINGAKNTHLIVNDCTFIDCSSKFSGGAINFKSISSQLTVTNSHFISTFISGNQNGGAICIQFQQNKLPFLIQNCFFLETSASNGGSIFILPNTDSSSSEVIIDGCDFKSSSASTNGHSIYISHTDTNKVTISSCKIIDCGNDKKTYSIHLDVNELDFKYNNIAFSDPENSCGCVNLAIIGTHVFNGNSFKNARYDESIWKSPGINGDVQTEFTSLLIQNNTFDSMHGTNQGRCFFIISKGNNNVQIMNNTIQNCPSGGSLLKIWFQTQINTYKIESCNFINNYITDCYDLIGPTPHIWIENPFNGDHIYPFELILENCHFEKGSNTRKGGGLQYGKIKYGANIKLILNQCHFIDNFAEEGGGALSVQTYQGCEIKNCKFIKNRSNNGCGAVFIETDFQCLKDDYSDKTGVLPLPNTRNPTVFISNSNFEDNNGKEKHGINIINSVNVPIEILECVFINCGLNGYVISIDTDIQLNTIKNCTFNYTTEQTSGGIYNINDKLILIGNSFCNFRETVIRFPCEESQKFQLIENTFFDCQNCYILYIEKVLSYCPTIKGNHFDSISGNNQLCYIKFKDDIDTITFDNNSFTNFAMNSEYGGISLNINHEDSNILLTFVFIDCTFINNTNTKLGGAIYIGSIQNSGNVVLTLKNCFFIKNYNNDKGSSIYCNVKNGITIDDCSFSENSGSVNGVVYIEQNYGSDSAVSEVSIINCHFQKNIGKDSALYLANGSTKTIKIKFCEFEQDTGGIYTDNFNNQIEIKNNVFHGTIEKAALIINSPIKTENTITIEYCVFDSCFGLENQCFSIVINTKLLTFLDNIIQNNKGTGYSNYLGTIDCSGEISELNIHNISFINNKCNSLYGGGIGLQFKSIQQLTFDDCKFIKNEAQQDTSMSRPTKDSKVYYNKLIYCFKIANLLVIMHFVMEVHYQYKQLDLSK